MRPANRPTVRPGAAVGRQERRTSSTRHRRASCRPRSDVAEPPDTPFAKNSSQRCAVRTSRGCLSRGAWRTSFRRSQRCPRPRSNTTNDHGCTPRNAPPLRGSGSRQSRPVTGATARTPAHTYSVTTTPALATPRNAVAVIVRNDIALEGLDLSGLVPEMNEAESCAHRRRSMLASKLPELCAEDRFVVPAGIKLPPGLALHTLEDGAGVSIECEHPGCAAAGTQEIAVSWDPRMPQLARTSILVRNV